jgi:hypothetical protein
LAQEIAASAATLAGTAEDLTALVGRFRLAASWDGRRRLTAASWQAHVTERTRTEAPR